MMLLRNRRLRYIQLALAGADIAVVLPFLLTWIALGRIWSAFNLPVFAESVFAHPLLLFTLCWLTMIAYMFTVDLLNRRQLESPRRELVFMVLVLFTSTLWVRLLLYPLHPALGLAWIGETARSVFNFAEGVLPPLLIILLNTYIWIRVAMAMDREIGFFSIGVGFRLGLLIALIGGTLLASVGGYTDNTPILYFSIYYALGLFAIAIARIDEKAVGHANRSGRLLPYARVVEIAAPIFVIFAITFAAQFILNPATIRRAFVALDPVWSVIGWALSTVIIAVFIVIGPLIERMILALQRMAANAEPFVQQTQPMGPIEYLDVQTVMREWTVLRYCFVIGAIALVLFVLWFYFVKPDDAKIKSKDDDDVPEETSQGMRPSLPGLGFLRNRLAMLRKYGVSRQLLHVISVENMYANLGRVAGRRGYPRPPSQPPDRYVSALECAFPGQRQALERLTQAYMQVHYGDHPVDGDELKRLRTDYDVVMDTPAAHGDESATPT